MLILNAVRGLFEGLRPNVREWARAARAWSSAVDPRHLARVIQLEALWLSAADHPTQKVHVRALGRSVELRECTSDIAVLADTFLGLHHLPPIELQRPRTILDLGANVGLTAAHYAALYPEARILGVELDPLAAAVARRNVQLWGERCTVLTGGAWTFDGEVSFERLPTDEWAQHVSARSETSVQVPGFSIGTLVERLGGAVDFLKMDVEGAEEALLTENTQWARRVTAIKVEVHRGPEALERCRAALIALGYTVRADAKHWASLIAVR
jgi:FkbM family methyltransferase